MCQCVRISRFLLMSTLMAVGAAGTVHAHQPYMVTDTDATRVDRP